MTDNRDTLTWEEIEGRSAQDLLQDVVGHHRPVTILVPSGKTVTVAPEITSHRTEAWERERTFMNSLLEQGPVEGGRQWTREDLHDR